MGNKHAVEMIPASRAPARPHMPAARGKASRRAKPDGNAGSRISPDEREQLISLGAYYRAEARGFGLGRELDDWLEAESEVDFALNGRNASPDSV